MINVKQPADHNLEAILLSMMMNDTDGLEEGVFRLKPEHFFYAKNKNIFNAMKNLVKSRREVDVLTVSHQMKKDKTHTSITNDYLNELSGLCSTGSGIESKILMAYELANRRRLITKSLEVINDAVDGKDTDEIVRDLQGIELIQKLSKIKHLKGSIDDKILKAIDDSNSDKDLLGLPLSDWSLLEKYLDGLQPGFYVVAGKSQSAKSMMALNMALQVLEKNIDAVVLYFSLDDNFKMGYYRTLSYFSRIGISDVALIRRHLKQISDPDLRKKAESRYNHAVKRTKNLMSRFFILDVSEGSSWVYIRDTIEEFAKKHADLVVFIDNFHVVRKDEFEGEETRFGFDKLSYNMKEVQNRFSIPLIATVELRKINHLGRPTADDMKETGSLDYDSDVQLLLHNDFRMKDGKTELKARIYKDEFILATDRDAEVETVFPIIEANLKKNKIGGGREEKVYYVLIKPLSILYELPESIQRKCRQITVRKHIQKEDKE